MSVTDSHGGTKIPQTPQARLIKYIQKKSQHPPTQNSNSKDNDWHNTAQRKKSQNEEREHGNSSFKQSNFNNVLMRKAAKAAAFEFMQRSDMFPKENDFITKRQKFSFEQILRNQLENENCHSDDVSFQLFLHSNIRQWTSACNTIRKKLICKCKDRYFSKCTSIKNNMVPSRLTYRNFKWGRKR